MADRLSPDPHHPGAWVVRIGDTDQSWIDPDDPTHLEFDYVQRVADVVDLVAPAGERIRAVHVGGGGLTLPRYVAATRPTSAQVVLEPDEELTAEVRRTAPLPPRSGIKVRAQDGRSGLAAMPGNYCDLLIVDAFAGARVPGELATVEAFAEYRRVLAPRGTLTLNVTDSAPLAWTRRLLAGARRHFPVIGLMAESATLKGRRFGNIVVVATADETLDWDRLSRRAAGAAFPFRVSLGPAVDRLVAGAAPYEDSGAEASPAPPGGATSFR